MGEAVAEFSKPFCDVEYLKLLYGVSSRDSQQRTQVLDSVMRMFEDWLEGYASPSYKTIPNYSHNDCANATNGDINQGALNGFTIDLKYLIREQLPDLLRLKLTCPFSDVREKCAYILQDLEVSVFCCVILCLWSGCICAISSNYKPIALC